MRLELERRQPERQNQRPVGQPTCERQNRALQWVESELVGAMEILGLRSATDSQDTSRTLVPSRSRPNRF